VVTAVGTVLMAVQELHSRSKIRPADTDPTLLISAFYHFMIAACALWTEFACHVSLNTVQVMRSSVCLALFSASAWLYALPTDNTNSAVDEESRVTPSVVSLFGCASFMSDRNPQFAMPSSDDRKLMSSTICYGHK
jgi:hypothetical protein